MRRSKTQDWQNKTSYPSRQSSPWASDRSDRETSRWARSLTASSPSSEAGRARRSPRRIRGRAESARELAPLVGKVSAELAGGTEEYRRAQAPVSRRRSRDVHVRVIAVAGKGRDRASRVRSAAIELTRELEVFSLSDWERVLAGLGIPNPAEALATLVEENTVFEPKAGFFRAVALNP